ncbi:MAG TPA: gas vesicle protein [Thermoanaerobaculia bacterium]|nr:gas vesicle protein [Thermoanaerobaculia bacterium]
MTSAIEPTYRRSSGLVDVLDRVLDKGLVIAGDIRVSLAEVELLTIRIRLLVCSIDKAEQIGLDWWRQDPNLSVAARRLSLENETLREQVRALEERVAALALDPGRPAPRGNRGKAAPTKKSQGGQNAG